MADGISLGLADSRYCQPVAQRLKGAAASLRARNFLTAIPLTAPPVWSASAFLAGQTVVSSGNMYDLLTGGTSTVAPTGTSDNTIAGGDTLKWSYRGPTNPTTSAVDAPTQTPWNTTLVGITNSIQLKISDGSLNPSKIRICNVGAAFLDKNQNICGVNSTLATGTVNGNINGAVPGISQYSLRIEFLVNCLTFSPIVTAQCMCRVEIDDQPLDVGGTQIGNAGTGANGTTFTFNSRKTRKISIEIPQGIQFTGLYIGRSDTVSATKNPFSVRGLAITDSYGNGGQGYPLVGGRYCFTKLAHALGWDDFNVASVGSTGITNPGSNSQGNFLSRLSTDIKGNYLTIPVGVNGTTTTVVQTGNTIAVTCPALAHNLFVGQSVTLAGLDVPSLNGTFTVKLGTTPSTTAFSLTSQISQSVSAGVSGTIVLNYTNLNTFWNMPWVPWDVIVTHLSVNDGAYSAATEAANAVALYQAIRAAFPVAYIVFNGIVANPANSSGLGVGTPVNGSFLGATVTTLGYIEAYVQQQLTAAAAAVGDSRFWFFNVTAITDPAGLNAACPAFSGIGFSGFGSPSGAPTDVTGNNSRMAAWAASVAAAAHYTDMGADYYALQFANNFKSQVLATIN